MTKHLATGFRTLCGLDTKGLDRLDFVRWQTYEPVPDVECEECKQNTDKVVYYSPWTKKGLT